MMRRLPKASISQKSAVAALTQLLHFCTEERLAGFTAASLAASYRVPLAKVEQMLAAARRARAA
jgi:hypothetical protein